MAMSEYDKKNIKGILFYGEGDYFTARLLRLINKADSSNREKLRLGFPEEVEAYESYMRGDGNESSGN